MEKNKMKLSSTSTVSWRPPQGKLLHRVLRSDPTNEYLLYHPTGASIDSPLLVVIFGAGRHWKEQVAAFVPGCERLGVTLLSPSMSGSVRAVFRSIGRQQNRADLLLHDCLSEVSQLTSIDVTRFRLFGHSSGAQFVHRYVMAHPHRVKSAAIACARWYTFPDTSRKFPFGIRSTKRLPDIVFDPEQYLQVRLTIFNGTSDIETEASRYSEQINAQQGINRLERARRWVAAMNVQAKAHAMKSMIELIEIDRVGYLFGPLCRDGRLVQRVFWSLFGATIDDEVEIIQRQ